MSAEIQQQELLEPAAIAQVNTAVAEFDRVAAGIGALKQQYEGVVFDVATTAGMKAACEARAAIRAPRYEVEKVRKAVKAPILALGRDIDTRAAKITADLLAIEEPIDSHIKAEESRKEAERKAKAEAERARVAAIQDDIENDLRCVPAKMIGRSAADMERALIDVIAITITTERFQEFSPIADQVKSLSIDRLRSMLEQQRAQEAEQERLRIEREQLEQQRLANEAAAKAERERIAAEQAEAQRKAQAEAVAAAAERKRLLDIEMARLRAEREENERAAKVERERLAQERFQQEAAAAERQRTDQAAQLEQQRRLDDERAAAQAEHARIAADNARQAEELRRQQQAIEQQRAELERQQQQIAAAQAPQPPAPVESPQAPIAAAHEPVAAPEAAKEWQPSAADLIGVIAADYGVTHDTAGRWLRDAFAPIGE